MSVWKACEQTPLSRKQAGVARGFCHAFDMYFQLCKGTWRIDVMGEESQACVPGVLRTCHPLLDIWWASCWTTVLNVACAALLQPWRTCCIYFSIFATVSVQGLPSSRSCVCSLADDWVFEGSEEFNRRIPKSHEVKGAKGKFVGMGAASACGCLHAHCRSATKARYSRSIRDFA